MELTKQQRNTWIGFGVGILLVVIVIILAVTIPKRDGRASRGSDESTPPTTEDIGIPAVAMEAFTAAPFIYTFNGIEWIFEPADAEKTTVKAKLKDFSRREGVVVQFANPYRLGTYNGECQEVPALSYETSNVVGKPIAYAVCLKEAKKSEFAVLQDGQHIRFMHRAVDGETVGEFEGIMDLDMASIVR